MALITFSGLASGIDSSALIEATLEQQRAIRIAPFEREIEEKQATNDAFSTLKTLLEELSSTVQPFRYLNGGAIAKTVLSSDDSVISATASNSAEAGTYSLTVSQLAKNATFSFDDRFTSGTDAINSSINDGAIAADRTVSYTIGSGAEAESIDIELTSTMTANDFVSQFNLQSDKATASLVNTGTTSTPSYAIVIQSNSEGLEEGEITLNSVGAEVQTAGAGAFTSSQLEQATNLVFSLAGVAGTITRSSNTVTDVIQGVSFTAQDIGTASITVGTDSGTTEGLIQDFVDKYNEIIEFIKENDAITESESKGEITHIFGPLASTSLDDGLLSALRSELSGAGTSGRVVNILADLGITTERDGTLSFNSDTFQTALANDGE
ncbi:MAG: flagellar filament capping protein FliD, partial [Bdellovibrionales bacterium]|nr:flagellar filament capping protein FliD [Bdellovibrionales bacterium]